MPNKYESICAVCGKVILRSSKSRPAGEATCRTCYLQARAALRHGSGGYIRGCRCEICKGDYSAKDRQRRAAQARLRQPKPVSSCAVCGRSFVPRTKRHLCCSSDCGHRYTNARRAAEYRAATARRTCVVCGDHFDGFGGQKICSDACQRRRTAQHQLNRKARVIGNFVAPVDRVAIFERDKWRCYRCGCRLLKNRTVPHPRAATIDHLIPVTRGGTHEPANVKACCHGCNIRKGNRGGNEQLLLIG